MSNPEKNILIQHLRAYIRQVQPEMPNARFIALGRRDYLKVKKVLGDSPTLEQGGATYQIIEDRELRGKFSFREEVDSGK